MYTFQTTKGRFAIILRGDRWRAMFEDEDLGPYVTPQQAAADLAGGHTFSASCGDTAVLGIPDDIREWKVSRSP
jgi:hypothetical protein